MEKDKKIRQTFPVSDELFKTVYDSPSSLPGRFKWVTSDTDVRKIEEILKMKKNTIGAPLWLSGNRKSCPKCKRQLSWLDIVGSALKRQHGGDMIAKIILGTQKYVNTEVPNHIEGLQCFGCGTLIKDIRSFKCHNWAYAIGAIQRVILRMNQR